MTDDRAEKRLGKSRKALIVGLLLALGVLGTAAVAFAAVTWNPAYGARTLNMPRTCNNPALTCTDSGSSYTDGAPALAVANNGTTHYIYSYWASDRPSGNEAQEIVPFGTVCSTTVNPNTGVAPYCSGTYFARSSNGGTTWTAPAAISPTNTHAERLSLSARGQYVFATYVTTVGYQEEMCALDPRVLYVRVSSDYGATWGAAVRLSSLSGRVDYPSIAASTTGSSVFAVATNSATGQVIAYKSIDNGANWTSQAVGWTTNTYNNGTSPGAPTCPGAPSPAGREGFSGEAAIASTGTSVGAGWIQTPGGRAVLKVSTDNGVTWPGGQDGLPCTMGGGNCTLHLTAGGAGGAGGQSLINMTSAAGRLGVTWVDDVSVDRPQGVWAQVFTESGGWTPRAIVSCFKFTFSCQISGAGGTVAPAPVSYNDGYSPAIAFFGTTGVAVSWSDCPYKVIGGKTYPKKPCSNKPGDPGADLLWKESPDQGAHWGDYSQASGEPWGNSYRLVASNSAGDCNVIGDPCSEVNEWPSIALDTPGSASGGCTQQGNGTPSVGCVRYIQFVGRMKDYHDYRLYMVRATTS